MKNKHLLLGVFLLSIFTLCAKEIDVFRKYDRFTVRYQVCNPEIGVWNTVDHTFRNVRSAAALQTALQRRHGNCKVRLISVLPPNVSIRCRVRYAYRPIRKEAVKNNWLTSNLELSGALNEEMALNQLRERHEKCEVRLISMSKITIR